MPPKKQDNKPKKDKAKMVDDKTFGLKNKNKSTKVSKYVQNVVEQAEKAGDRKTLKAAADEKARIQAKKDFEARKKDELADLFKPIQVQQKVPFGTDPKTVLCAFFKAGTCQKGSKCKFSHNLEADRKAAKIDLYSDNRNEEDNMEDWDQSKLEEVVLSKHGNPRTTTDIVCKYFLEAIESQKYGWFWECPNGAKDCKYRHALPPGFVLKSKKKDEIKEEISLEEFLETERHKLGANLTPITLESFTAWKQSRKAKLDAETEAARKSKETAVRAGKNLNLSGREFFDYNPDWDQFAFYEEDDAAFDFDGLTDHREQNNEQSEELPSVEKLQIEAN